MGPFPLGRNRRGIQEGVPHPYLSGWPWLPRCRDPGRERCEQTPLGTDVLGAQSSGVGIAARALRLPPAQPTGPRLRAPSFTHIGTSSPTPTSLTASHHLPSLRASKSGIGYGKILSFLFLTLRKSLRSENTCLGGDWRKRYREIITNSCPRKCLLCQWARAKLVCCGQVEKDKDAFIHSQVFIVLLLCARLGFRHWGSIGKYNRPEVADNVEIYCINRTRKKGGRPFHSYTD